MNNENESVGVYIDGDVIHMKFVFNEIRAPIENVIDLLYRCDRLPMLMPLLVKEVTILRKNVLNDSVTEMEIIGVMEIPIIKLQIKLFAVGQIEKISERSYKVFGKTLPGSDVIMTCKSVLLFDTMLRCCSLDTDVQVVGCGFANAHLFLVKLVHAALNCMVPFLIQKAVGAAGVTGAGFTQSVDVLS